MNGRSLATLAVAVAVSAGLARGASAATLAEQVLGPFRAYVADGARLERTADGAVRYLATGTGHALATPAAADAAGRARAFVRTHGAEFALTSRTDLALERSETGRGRSWQRFQQTLDGVPVIGAETVVQLDGGGNVEAVLHRATPAAELGRLSTVPVLAANAVAAFARRAVAPGGEAVDTGAPSLAVFVPTVFEGRGAPRLVWRVKVAGGRDRRNEELLLDAGDGALVWRFSLDADALNRTIQDAANGRDRPFTTVRTEGGAASTIADANRAYDYLGDTYSYYSTQNGRDSFDGAGAALNGVVRYCGFATGNNGGVTCFNASFNSSDTMYVGPGFAADDVIAHEVTHGVTSRTSKLAYQNASGAINESLSDIWGEFVDLQNGRGSDADTMRWQVGEDLSVGTIRSMKYPKTHGQPDRLGDSLYVPPSGSPSLADDFGGVHTNSGVNNKLCYLLTDGGTFNGQTVTGVGTVAVVRLYYEAQTHLLTSSSGWTELFDALRQAARNLGWDSGMQNDLYRACAAVEIATHTTVYADAASGCGESGTQSCVLGLGPFRTLGGAQAAIWPGTVVVAAPGTYHEGLITFDKNATYTANGGTVVITP